MLDNPEIQKMIRIEVLVNAKMYKGKANPKAVMGKMLGKNKELRPFAKDLTQYIGSLADEISKKSMEEIDAELKEIAPDAVKKVKKTKEKKAKKRREQKKDLPEIKDAVKGKFVVRYAPDPSKYPHIGQGMNYLINRMYADKYDGKVVLRFDDTNPTITKKIYFDSIKEGMQWLGCTWDEEIRASQFIEEFYDVARDWINKKQLYVCLCEGDLLRTQREDKIACEHREQSVEKNQELFAEMVDGKYKPGEAIVRLMGDMTSENNVMRDPIMFRVVTDQHEMLDTFYHVFPTYDFESPYLDWKMGITHIIRSGEFGSMRLEQQSYIIEKLGGKVPSFVSFGRFNIQGCPTKGRVIRELVETKVVSGWDDIRLITLVGLKNRGIHPMTPRLLIQEAGLTPKNTNIAWTTLEKKSKELIEPVAKRIYFVHDPVKITVSGGNKSSVDLPNHPDNPKMGTRNISVSENIWVVREDINSLKVGDVIRLKDLYNIKITTTGDKEYTAEYSGDEIVGSMQKIQWVSDNYVEGTLLVPDLLEKKKGEINEDSLSEISGYFEENIRSITPEDIVQLERVGYARIKENKDKIAGHIIHK